MQIYIENTLLALSILVADWNIIVLGQRKNWRQNNKVFLTTFSKERTLPLNLHQIHESAESWITFGRFGRIATHSHTHTYILTHTHTHLTLLKDFKS